MGQGVFFSSIYNKLKKQPEIFCPPAGLSITGDITNSVLEKYLQKSPAGNNDEVSVILIFALQDAFPCR
jgi:hypothetical protein